MDILKQLFLKRDINVLLSPHNQAKQFVKHLCACEMESVSPLMTLSLLIPDWLNPGTSETPAGSALLSQLQKMNLLLKRRAFGHQHQYCSAHSTVVLTH